MLQPGGARQEVGRQAERKTVGSSTVRGRSTTTREAREEEKNTT